jgi:hypothetical protein
MIAQGKRDEVRAALGFRPKQTKPCKGDTPRWNLASKLATLPPMSHQPDNIFAGAQVVSLFEVRGTNNSLAWRKKPHRNFATSSAPWPPLRR